MRRSRAPLPRRADRAEEDRGDRDVKVGAGGDDDRGGVVIDVGDRDIRRIHAVVNAVGTDGGVGDESVEPSQHPLDLLFGDKALRPLKCFPACCCSGQGRAPEQKVLLQGVLLPTI